MALLSRFLRTALPSALTTPTAAQRSALGPARMLWRQGQDSYVRSDPLTRGGPPREHQEEMADGPCCWAQRGPGCSHPPPPRLPQRNGVGSGSMTARCCAASSLQPGAVCAGWMPAADGPHKTLYSRCRRWSDKGVFDLIFSESSASDAPEPDVLMIDATDLKAHPTASSLNKGGCPRLTGGTKGGMSSKLHGVCPSKGGPLRLHLPEGAMQ